MYLTVVLDYVMGVSPMIDLNPFVETTRVLDYTVVSDKADKAAA